MKSKYKLMQWMEDNVEAHQDGFDLLEEYTEDMKKITLHCEACNHNWELPNCHICPHCETDIGKEAKE